MQTFCFEAVEARGGDPRSFHICGDFERADRDAAISLEENPRRFAAEKGVEIVFDQFAVTDKVREHHLPTREPERTSKADKNWPFRLAGELDAIPPTTGAPWCSRQSGDTCRQISTGS
jgi:hypothetical protein